MKLYDISMEIKGNMIGYPGNPKASVTRINGIPNSSTNVSRLIMGTHTGTHVDARKHIENKGQGVDKIPLRNYYGKCKVLDLRQVKFGNGIEKQHLKKFNISKGDIILLKTKNSSTGYKKFRKDFIYLSEDAAKYLVKKRITTVGIDYLSIQKFRTGYCAAHCVFLKKNIPIFEGLDFSKVKPGSYVFVGLPLKIKDGDGAPARAILVDI